MLFRQFFESVSSTYTYLLADERSKEALIIDPVKEKTEFYVQYLHELGLKLIYVLDTHTHADHITASGPLRQATGCKIVMGEESKAPCVDVRLKDQQVLTLGEINLKAIYTPGHTNESYSFLVGNMLFTGDVLLIRGTGRTDFQEGDAKKQYHSIFNVLFKLPEDTLVYPAHDYQGRMVSTLREEKAFNPRLQVKTIDEYVEIMDSLNLARPKQMDVAVPANLKCGLE